MRCRRNARARADVRAFAREREIGSKLPVRALDERLADRVAVFCTQRDRFIALAARRELTAHYTLAASAADIRAGLVLVSPECDVNCSFETLLALSRERTERGAAKLLFAE